MLVEAFVAQPPVEALDVGILHGLAGIDEVQPHPMGVSPSVQDPPGEFRAVVYGDQLRQANRSEILRAMFPPKLLLRSAPLQFASDLL